MSLPIEGRGFDDDDSDPSSYLDCLSSVTLEADPSTAVGGGTRLADVEILLSFVETSSF